MRGALPGFHPHFPVGWGSASFWRRCFSNVKKILVLLPDRSLLGLQSLGSGTLEEARNAALIKKCPESPLGPFGGHRLRMQLLFRSLAEAPLGYRGYREGQGRGVVTFGGLAGRPAGGPDAGRATLEVSLCGGQHPDINGARNTSQRQAKPGARRKQPGRWGKLPVEFFLEYSAISTVVCRLSRT